MFDAIRQFAAKLVRAGGVESAITGAGTLLKRQARRQIEANPSLVKSLSKESAQETVRQRATQAVEKAPAPSKGDLASAAERIRAIQAGRPEPGGIAQAKPTPAEETKAPLWKVGVFEGPRGWSAWSQQIEPEHEPPVIQPETSRESAQRLARDLAQKFAAYGGSVTPIAIAPPPGYERGEGTAPQAQTAQRQQAPATPPRPTPPQRPTAEKATQSRPSAAEPAPPQAGPPPPIPPVAPPLPKAPLQPEAHQPLAAAAATDLGMEPPKPHPPLAEAARADLGMGPKPKAPQAQPTAPAQALAGGGGTPITPAAPAAGAPGEEPEPQRQPQQAATPRQPLPKNKLSPVAQIVQAALGKTPPKTKGEIEELVKPMTSLGYSMRELIGGIHELRNAGHLPETAALSRPAQLVERFTARQTEPLPEDVGELRKRLRPLARESGYTVKELAGGAQELKEAGRVPEPAVAAEEVHDSFSDALRSFIDGLKKGRLNLDAFTASFKGGGDRLRGLFEVFLGLGQIFRGARTGNFRTGRNSLLGGGIERVKGGFSRFVLGTAGRAGKLGKVAGGAAGGAAAGGAAEGAAAGGGGIAGTAVGGALRATAGGPIGIAIGAVLTLGSAAIAAALGIAKFTQGTLKADQEFAKFNARIGYAFARLQLGDIRRSIRTGQQIAPSTTALVNAVNELKEDSRELVTMLRNLANIGAYLAVQIARFQMKTNPILVQLGIIAKILNWLMSLGAKEGNGNVWMEAIREQANRYKQDVQAGKIKIPVQKPVKWRGLHP
ncbi:MAG: hypothetical protein ACREQ5_04115 [Candidatus Dormibacteria bacterium]